MKEPRHHSPRRQRQGLGLYASRWMWPDQLGRLLRLKSWFPQVLLALAVGLAGLVHMLPAFGSLRQFVTLPTALPATNADFAQGLIDLGMHGISSEIFGGLLILLSLGLLLRSRLAWSLTVLLTAGSVAVPALTSLATVSTMTGYNAALFIVMLLGASRFNRSSLAISTSFALIGMLITVGYGVLGSYALGQGFSPPITKFTEALYYSLITVSTVGYGDILPKSVEAQMFTISLIVLGLAVFATSLTTIAGPVIGHRMQLLLEPRKKPMKRTNHFIVVGNNPLARNVIKSLQARRLRVTAIWPDEPPAGVEPPEDMIVGDATSSAVLEAADVKDANTVLALLDNDADNAFVSLAAKEANPKLRTLLAVNDAQNLDKMRRVKPDAVLALPVIGAELIAMELAGEEVKTDKLFEKLLRLD